MSVINAPHLPARKRNSLVPIPFVFHQFIKSLLIRVANDSRPAASKMHTTTHSVNPLPYLSREKGTEIGQFVFLVKQCDEWPPPPPSLIIIPLSNPYCVTLLHQAFGGSLSQWLALLNNTKLIEEQNKFFLPSTLQHQHSSRFLGDKGFLSHAHINFMSLANR